MKTDNLLIIEKENEIRADPFNVTTEDGWVVSATDYGEYTEKFGVLYISVEAIASPK